MVLGADVAPRVKGHKARQLKTDQVDYWEGALQLLFYKLCLKMIDYGSGRTQSFWIKNTDPKMLYAPPP